MNKTKKTSENIIEEQNNMEKKQKTRRGRNVFEPTNWSLAGERRMPTIEEKRNGPTLFLLEVRNQSAEKLWSHAMKSLIKEYSFQRSLPPP